jgi:hypothetical protein
VAENNNKKLPYITDLELLITTIAGNNSSKTSNRSRLHLLSGGSQGLVFFLF